MTTSVRHGRVSGVRLSPSCRVLGGQIGDTRRCQSQVVNDYVVL